MLEAANGSALLARWIRVGGGLPMSDVTTVRIAVAPSNANRLYVVMGDRVGSTDINGWSSGNGGGFWKPLNVPEEAGNSFMSIAVSPASASELYLGTQPILYRSLDGGQIFSDREATRTLIHADIPALAFDAAQRLLVGTDGGIYRTADFENFENLNTNLSTMLVDAGISGSLAGGGPVLAGFQDNATGMYTGSLLWHETATHGGNGSYTAVDPRSPGVLYRTAFWASWIEKSVDGGKTHLHPHLEHPDWSNQVGLPFPFVMDLERPDTFYAGTYRRLWRSANAGDDWNAIDPTFPDGAWPTAIAPALSDEDVVYVAHGDGRIFVTRDGAGQWTDTSGNGLPNRHIPDIAVHPKRAGEAWATVSGFGSGHVFHTDDYGGTWNDISGNLADAPVHAIAIDERRTPPSVFVGTDVGVFVSFDNGGHWAKTGPVCPTRSCTTC